MVPSTDSQKYPRSLGASGPFIGPTERNLGQTIGVGNECQDALAQVSHRRPTRTSEQAANQVTPPDLNLVEPRTVLGRIDQANAMGRVREKGSPRLHRGQMTA